MADNTPLIVGQNNTTRGTTRLRNSVFPPQPVTGTLVVETDGSPAAVATSTGAVGVLGVGILGVDSAGSIATGGVSGQGFGPGGVGLMGSCPEGFGVVATGQIGGSAQGSVVGLLAYSEAGPGVLASSSRASGVEARSVSGSALAAASDRGPGAVVSSRTGPGLVAQSAVGAAVHASTGSGIAVRGLSGVQGWAGYLQGRVGVEGAVTVLGGPISEAVGPPQSGVTYRRLYSHMSPESWIEDFGTAQLSGGTVTVQLRADFAALIQPGSYDVFLTAYGAAALFVQSRAVGSFQVNRIQNVGGNQAASARFAYRIVGRSLAARPRLGPVQMFGETILRRVDAVVRRATTALTTARTRADMTRRAEKALKCLKPIPKARKRPGKKAAAKR